MPSGVKPVCGAGSGALLSLVLRHYADFLTNTTGICL